MLQIFRVGKHDQRLTPTVLVATAAAYNPNNHEAPLVVGHPSHDAPAHGWVSSLRFDERTGSLEAEPAQINPEFAEAVNAGRFKKISASFYTPKHLANPSPGNFYLKHVGLLGAQVLAVKGMRAVQFGEQDDAGVAVALKNMGIQMKKVFNGLQAMEWAVVDYLSESTLSSASRSAKK